MHLALSAPYLGTDLAGRYRLERLIGEGATSWVFAALDLRLEREVAVKLLKPRAEPEHAAQRLCFVREGRTLAKLAHPHVVAVHDAGETPEGHGYLVMELSRAGSLEQKLVRRATLGPEETLNMLLPLLGALACAHDRGIVHRDLKPANIALVLEGDKTRAKLLDFGIAKLADLAASTDGAMGTPAYMAPEQARAETIGPATDVWAMGVILFRCLSGKLPFEASSAAGILLKVVQERAPRLGSVCPELPPHVALAIDPALEPDPRHRYPDMRTFARMLGIACRQDGLRLEAHPEPIGLPDFAVWLQQANLETTQPKSLAEPLPVQAIPPRAGGTTELRPSVPFVAPSSPQSHATRVPFVLLAAVALVVAGAAMWATSGRSAANPGERSPAAATRLISKPDEVSASAVTKTVSTQAPETPNTPAAAQPPQAREPTAKRKKLAPKLGRPGRDVTITNAREPVGATDKNAPGLITSWEW